jgi:hypothetical protein
VFGFGTAACRGQSHWVAAGSPLPDYLSPAYLYARTRMVEGSFPQDAGATIADESFDPAKLRSLPGIVLPYDQDPSEAPTPACDVAAVPFRIDQAVQVDWSNPSNVKAVLGGNTVITIGFTVYQSFENTGADGIVPMADPASEAVLGGHGVLVCGFDNGKQIWIVRNQWGDGGYCYMPYGYEALTWSEARTFASQV